MYLKYKNGFYVNNKLEDDVYKFNSIEELILYVTRYCSRLVPENEFKKRTQKTFKNDKLFMCDNCNTKMTPKIIEIEFYNLTNKKTDLIAEFLL